MTEISCLFSAMELVRMRLSKRLPSQHISLLLIVATRPGITMPELSEVLDMPQGTVSRNVRSLSHFLEQEGEVGRLKGHGLLRTERDSHIKNALAVYLTDKGERLIADIVRRMRPAFRGYESPAGGQIAAAC